MVERPYAGRAGKLSHDVEILREKGINLRFPRCSKITTSRHGQMRELRIQHEGRPYRALYAFDPNRAALLLIGGDKTGNDRWYETFVPIADRLYRKHLKDLEENQQPAKQDESP